ncbi:MAG TPA: rubrerythrin family protein [Armatimonadota bacterium]|jgi:rubrerythrin
MELKGSTTEANLQAAFAGESQARNRYTFYASAAKKRGLEQIASIFLETAENEREHAKLFLKALGGLKGDTEANLLEAAGGEKHEWESMYPEFARVARQEGFEEVAQLFEGIAAIEAEHEARYRTLAEKLSTETLFHQPEPTRWVCRNCGHVHEGPDAPKVCPVCQHPQGFFQQG